MLRRDLFKRLLSSLFKYLWPWIIQTPCTPCCHLYSNTQIIQTLVIVSIQIFSCSGMTYISCLYSNTWCDLFSLLLSVNMIPISIQISSCSGMTYSVSYCLWTSPSKCRVHISLDLYLAHHTPSDGSDRGWDRSWCPIYGTGYLGRASMRRNQNDQWAAAIAIRGRQKYDPVFRFPTVTLAAVGGSQGFQSARSSTCRAYSAGFGLLSSTIRTSSRTSPLLSREAGPERNIGLKCWLHFFYIMSVITNDPYHVGVSLRHLTLSSITIWQPSPPPTTTTMTFSPGLTSPAPNLTNSNNNLPLLRHKGLQQLTILYLSCFSRQISRSATTGVKSTLMIVPSAVIIISLRHPAHSAHQLRLQLYRIVIGTRRRGGESKTQRKQSPHLRRLRLDTLNHTFPLSRRKSKSKINGVGNVNTPLQSRKGHCPCLLMRTFPSLLVLVPYAIVVSMAHFLRCLLLLLLPWPQAPALAVLLHRVSPPLQPPQVLQDASDALHLPQARMCGSTYLDGLPGISWFWPCGCTIKFTFKYSRLIHGWGCCRVEFRNVARLCILLELSASFFSWFRGVFFSPLSSSQKLSNPPRARCFRQIVITIAARFRLLLWPWILTPSLALFIYLWSRSP